MALYEVKPGELKAIEETTFAASGVRERGDLQRLLRHQIGIVAPGAMVIAEEFGDWADSGRRIDLLAIDHSASLIVIELKRTEDGGHMELQALRYAAMVSTMTFDQIVTAHEQYLRTIGSDADARSAILSFLEWNEPRDDDFAQETRIVLVSADFSREITSTVIWLNQRGLDIRCVRLRPHTLDERLLLDIQQVLPLPEAQDFQVRLREKEERERIGRASKWDHDSFMQALRETRGSELAALAEDLHAFVAPDVSYFFWGRGIEKGGMVPILTLNDHNYHLFRIGSHGRVAMWFQHLNGKPPFTHPSRLEELRKMLNSIPGVALGSASGQPWFDLALLRSPDALRRFKEAIAWLVSQIRGVPADGDPA